MSKTTKGWIKQHLSDQYVKQAQQAGYPSRAAYKLLEIQKKYQLIKPGMIVVDLGASPGGWSMVASQILGPKGKVFAIDLLPMSPLSGVDFIQGDFNEQTVLDQLMKALDHQMVDLVMSDMAPNITGEKSVDQPRSIYLVELAWDLAEKVLKPGGSFLAKIFQGEGIDQLIIGLRKNFRQVKVLKPKASRAKSREVYVLAREFIRYNNR